jgi:adenylate cyclase
VATDDLTWLLTHGQRAPDLGTLVETFCRHLRATGLPIARASINVRILHPLLVGRGVLWTLDAPLQEAEHEREALESQGYLVSPIRLAVQLGQTTRRRLIGASPALDFPILTDLRAAGYTDYLAVPIETEPRSFATFASDAPAGFSDADLARIDAFLPPLVMLLATHSTRLVAASALETYLGRDAGGRVLGGRITRGEYDRIRAVIWLSDLRGFSALSERVDGGTVVALLNEYFDGVGGALVAEGGEILKFIGDAVLGIFALDGDDPRPMCDAALRAAEAALGTFDDRAVRLPGAEPLRVVLALHVGDVVYGNIGTADRLDFTVVGPAVNRAARIAELCKTLDRPLLVSGDVARHATAPLRSLGPHALRGFDDSMELFTRAGA